VGQGIDCRPTRSLRIAFLANDTAFFFRHFVPAIEAALEVQAEIVALLPESPDACVCERFATSKSSQHGRKAVSQKRRMAGQALIHGSYAHRKTGMPSLSIPELTNASGTTEREAALAMVETADSNMMRPTGFGFAFGCVNRWNPRDCRQRRSRVHG
jgi:hypothetical protein